MNYLIEDENFLTEKEKIFLNKEFERIPFFYSKRIGIYRRDAPVLVHGLVSRYDDPKIDNAKDRAVSPYTNFFCKYYYALQKNITYLLIKY